MTGNHNFNNENAHYHALFDVSGGRFLRISMTRSSSNNHKNGLKSKHQVPESNKAKFSSNREKKNRETLFIL